MIKKIVFWFCSLLVLTLLMRHIIVFKPGFLENTGSMVAHPFISVANKIASCLESITKRKTDYKTLSEQHARLTKKYEELFQAYLTLRTTSQFNEATQELVDFRQRYNFTQAILGKVLARTINPSEHTAIINRGSMHGVKLDMVAIHKLQIVGRVCECYPTMSKIMLLTDKRCKVAGFTNTTSAGGIVAGTNEPNKAEMQFVSHLSEINDEDFVFSSGQGLVFPEGFCLGKIAAHQHVEKELYHKITIEPLIDFEQLRYCLLASQEMINLF
jgi:rod shape-determining protein MreC